MKKLGLLFTLLTLSTLSFGQTTIDFGTLAPFASSPDDGAFHLPGYVIAGTRNSNHCCALFQDSYTGYVSFDTPALTSGDFVNGGSFGAGGTFTINDIVQGITYSGTFTGGTWTRGGTGNSFHPYFYDLLANFIDSNGQLGGMELVTVNDSPVSATWPGQAQIKSLNITVYFSNTFIQRKHKKVTP